MKTLKFTLKPTGPFATALQGDTLFGQLCWVLVRTEGEAFLNALLSDYAQKPFAVLSDAFPTGFLPKPSLPAAFLGAETQNPQERKQLKRKQWVPVSAVQKPVSEWLAHAVSDQEVLTQAKSEQKHLQSWQRHMHNSINRLTGTTGEVGFAPYAVDELWFAQNISWDIYAVIDEQKISTEQLEQWLTHIGATGYGKDASVGAGRFVIEQMQEVQLPQHKNANAVMALANVAPQGLALKPKGCFYVPFTRYGRHGDWAVLVNPFKAPILMAKTGAVLTPIEMTAEQYIGQALGGNGEISSTIPQTVHQGYAPVIAIYVSQKE